ncbi:MAG: hypothetical protein PHS86_12975 [Syntrophaceae bacterium]|nr:hypothetical protein [Syntrophaceae bacterium]
MKRKNVPFRVLAAFLLMLLLTPAIGSLHAQASDIKSGDEPIRRGAERVKLHDIRDVDFKNFKYQLSNAAWMTLEIARTTEVHNGEMSQHDGYFKVERQLYGDLTGDGRDEAVVIVNWGLEGANWWGTDIYVFTLADRLVQLALISEDATEHDYHRWFPSGGNASEGNVWKTLDDKITIQRQMLIIQRYVDGPHCCPENIASMIYRWDGNTFVLGSRPEKRKIEP